MSIQVAASHYARTTYDTKARWASYWHQADEVMRTRPSSCLEIGGGNGTIRRYLEAQGLPVVSVDIDSALGPDRVGDIRHLPCVDGEFDVVLCAEVLEHLPFPDVPQALREIARVTRRWAIVSVPHTGRGFELSFRIPPLRRVSFYGKLPGRRDFSFDGQHYWEVGAKNFSAAKVRDTFSAPFTIVRDFIVVENLYHHFYVLEKK